MVDRLEHTPIAGQVWFFHCPDPTRKSSFRPQRASSTASIDKTAVPEPAAAARPPGRPSRPMLIDRVCPPLAGEDLCLSIERQMVSIFADQHVGDGTLGRRAALDQTRDRRRLHDGPFACSAGISWVGALPAHGTGRERCPNAH